MDIMDIHINDIHIIMLIISVTMTWGLILSMKLYRWWSIRRNRIFCKRCGKIMHKHDGYSAYRQDKGWYVYCCLDFNKCCDYLEGVPIKEND